ncbi:molybdopterin-guanine dinucleotide biosynthesis protein B [uncultured Cetobacterium sp.]|uniref:molybdopterin-guanine dinucleotide biosynthesis protein B n=1 Tax=uncultured Cetobacterium sp. TaxID=527638 RepID=UPI00260C7D9C|nr:molybdopterin-guanine dinucleotide biosynthesis protein B [uncultured Cetobacterium sp.]
MIKTFNINTLILAGGKGRRLNYCNKALLKYNNQTFLDKIVDAFSNFNNIYISLNSSQDLITDKLIRVDDNFEDIGPISGLYEGLKESTLDYVFVVPCDTPNITKEFVEYIVQFVSDEYDAFLIKDKKGLVHPLMGVYNTRISSIIKESIENNDYKVLNILDKINVKYIDLSYTIFDDKFLLANINTEKDYNSLFSYKKSYPPFIAISGVKNSGKTTLITKLLEKFNELEYKVGTIKHDGHDFQMDNLNSDTDRHIKSGAFGTLIFSKSQFMYLEKSPEDSLEKYLNFFKNYDFILLEGFKYISSPKIEIIRNGISNIPVSNSENLLFYATDIENILNDSSKEAINLNNIDLIFNRILNYLNEKRRA